MAEIQYKYAYIDDDRDNIISIDEITTENRKQNKYRCIGCGNELLPRAIGSTKRTPHFYHKELVNCSGETYLHKLAKRIIKDRFDAEPTFYVEYNVTKECPNKECKYRNPRCIDEHASFIVDLKKNYDTCTEETTIDGFVADILLTNSKKTDLKPILIEVCVTHRCDDNKKASGLQIIEIRIRKEEDIICLLKEKVIRENRYPFEREIKVDFWSFQREFLLSPDVKLQRYVFLPQHNPLGYLTEIDCKNAQNRLRRDSLVELNVVNTNNYMNCDLMEIVYWLANNKGLRRCNLCKFYYATRYEDYPICRLSKKYGKPARPTMDEAEKCNSYQRDYDYNPEDVFLIEEVPSSPTLMRPEYKVILAVSQSFSDYDLFKEKVKYYLSNIEKTHSIVILTGASIKTDELTDQLTDECGYIKEPHKAKWSKYDNKGSAIVASNDEMTSIADALIAFWDEKSFGIKDMIEQAKQKNIKVAVVKYKQ